jgi:hypothetical protein
MLYDLLKILFGSGLHIYLSIYIYIYITGRYKGGPLGELSYEVKHINFFLKCFAS